MHLEFVLWALRDFSVTALTVSIPQVSRDVSHDVYELKTYGNFVPHVSAERIRKCPQMSLIRVI